MWYGGASGLQGLAAMQEQYAALQAPSEEELAAWWVCVRACPGAGGSCLGGATTCS